MKKIVLRYGAYASLWELIIFVLIWVVIGLFNPSHQVQGYIGWVNLICPLLFIYFGIRYYRDVINNGHITFLSALKVGLLIVILPAVAFAVIETTYVLYIDPHFYENLSKYDIEQYRKTLSADQFAVKLKQLHQQLEADKSPLFNFTAMVCSVGALGIIVTLVSSLLLMRKGKVETN
jgi:hypothetical protein